MGTEAAWVPLVISAIGAGANAYNQRQVAKRQEEEAQQASMTQQRHGREADLRLNQELDTLGASGPDEERRAALEGFLRQLRTNAGTAGGTTGVPGGSERYQRDTGAAGAAIKNYGTTRADILSRLEAPGQQRRGEAISAGRAGADVQGIGRNADADAFLSKLRLDAIRPNPWISAAGEIAQGAGRSAAGRFGRVTDADLIPIQQAGRSNALVGQINRNPVRLSPFG